MKLKRIMVLVSKAFIYGPKNLIFNFAVVMPVLISLFISLAAGTLFSDQARLGVADLGDSQLTHALSGLDYLHFTLYADADDLQTDVARGALDMGIVLPAGFDDRVVEDAVVRLDVFTWGESLLKHRTQLGAALVREVITLSGYELGVEITTVLLGDEAGIPWEVRLFPLVVIMTIILGGTMVPAAFIVEEKQHRTLKALLVTPVTLFEVLLAKGLAGVIISVVMGAVILTINSAWGIQPGLMVLMLILSAMMAASMGIIFGMLVGDISALFTAMKSIGILLYAPAIIYMFPQIPAWVMRIFPTYYMIGPIVEISMHNAGWGDIAMDLVILGALTVITVMVTGLLARRRHSSGA